MWRIPEEIDELEKPSGDAGLIWECWRWLGVGFSIINPRIKLFHDGFNSIKQSKNA